MLDGEEVRRRVPAAKPTVAGGVHASEDAFIDPCAVTRELARQAEKHGAKVLTETEALGFVWGGRRVTEVITTRGRFAPETVVLAAGVWSAPLARQLSLDLPLEPAKGYSITVQRPEGVPEQFALYLPEGHACVTPFGDRLRFAGTLELSGMNRRILDNRVAGIRRGVGRFLEGSEDAEPLQVGGG